MPKTQLKKRVAAAQGGVCALSGVELPPEPRLVDGVKIVPSAEYSDENTLVVDPVVNMEHHGVLRTRSQHLDLLKSVFDDRVQTMKLSLKISNQLGAYERRVDHRNAETEGFLAEQLVPVSKRLSTIDKKLTTLINGFEDPLVYSALNVPGMGPITVAALTVYVDLAKKKCRICEGAPDKATDKGGCSCPDGPTIVDSAATPSSLWKYVGIDKPSHERYEKGVRGGGNKTLRTVLWNSANVMMKLRTSGYREVYDRVKTRLSISENIVRSYEAGGGVVHKAWKDVKPSHRHGAALRAIMKHMLADYWFVGRTLAGLPTVPLYAESMLGHTHIVSPQTRGWIF